MTPDHWRFIPPRYAATAIFERRSWHTPSYHIFYIIYTAGVLNKTRIAYKKVKVIGQSSFCLLLHCVYIIYNLVLLHVKMRLCKPKLSPNFTTNNQFILKCLFP